MSDVTAAATGDERTILVNDADISTLRRPRLRSKMREAGFTLLELTMSLAIIAVLIGGIVMFFSSASTSQKTSDLMSELGNIQQAVHSMFSGQPNYSTITTSVISDSQQIPAKWGGGTGTLNDPFNGQVNITPSAAIQGGPATNGAFVVEMDSIPVPACVKIVTQDLGPSLLGVTIGSAPTVMTGAMTPVQAQAECAGASVNIFWAFY
jgi:major structural subunit of bundle-forming pilus